MRIGYARVSTGEQNLDLQIDALKEAGVEERYLYTDQISGAKAARPGLTEMMKTLREGDVVIVWKMDRLFRSLSHMVQTMAEFHERGVQFRSLQEPFIDTTSAVGKLIFRILIILAEFERDLIRERTVAGLRAARARGRTGGRKFEMTRPKVKQIAALVKAQETPIGEICQTYGISRSTLYRYVSPQGELRAPFWSLPEQGRSSAPQSDSKAA